ncbi:hypothetical protein JOQ06_001848 [Pogonophryne albipinna]|uniref:Uncharacterized protein n=1 Tax=Pogonophryne albipinna TaxID=1090488 RepID=A0AAD6FKT4_9TELE|nr:hypothetical protein JOQ06_001848 [Pogonophryne albipinna]
MQATLLAFNRESVDAYLARTFAIMNRLDEIKPTTTLHLCSAHIIKAVSNSVSRKTDDPEHVHPNVHQSLDFLQQLIAKGNNPTLENGDIDSESQSGWEEEEQKRANTIVIEAYMRATLNQYDPAHRIFQIDHYTNGVILGGSREQMSRHLMRNVNLDTFDAAVSFVNVNNNHWRFVYLHVPSRSLFVMDPAAAEQDLHLSTTAVQCYNRYFRMRQNLYGKQVWGSLKWAVSWVHQMCFDMGR